MKTQGKAVENQSLLEVYTYVLDQIDIEQKEVLGYIEELYELHMFGWFEPGHSQAVLEAGKAEHEAALNAYNDIRKKLEELLTKKA